MLAVFNTVPLLLWPILVYAGFAFAEKDAMRDGLAESVFSLAMPSDSAWVFTWGGLYLLVAIVCLFVEVMKSTRATTSALIDNGLSIALFIACFMLFLLAPGFATTEFFLMMMMTLLDFVAGSVIMVNTAQRTVTFDGQN